MITKITEIKGVDILNKHNYCVFKNQKIWMIELENGTKYLLDMRGNKDITNIDYLSLLESNKTKKKILFKDELFN
jgi:hypothetical protein